MVAFADLSLSFLFGLSALTVPVTSSGFLDAGNVLRSTVCEQIATEVSSSSVVYYTGTYLKSSPWWQSKPNFLQARVNIPKTIITGLRPAVKPLNVPLSLQQLKMLELQYVRGEQFQYPSPDASFISASNFGTDADTIWSE
jgi:hypothetical protein